MFENIDGCGRDMQQLHGMVVKKSLHFIIQKN